MNRYDPIRFCSLGDPEPDTLGAYTRRITAGEATRITGMLAAMRARLTVEVRDYVRERDTR